MIRVQSISPRPQLNSFSLETVPLREQGSLLCKCNSTIQYFITVNSVFANSVDSKCCAPPVPFTRIFRWVISQHSRPLGDLGDELIILMVKSKALNLINSADGYPWWTATPSIDKTYGRVSFQGKSFVLLVYQFVYTFVISQYNCNDISRKKGARPSLGKIWSFSTFK